jgi:hypothetical protein
LIEALDRYRSVRYGGRIWSVGWVIGVAAFAFSALGAIWLGNYAGAVFLGAFTGLLAVAQRVDNWWAKRAFRSTPHLDEELTLEFSGDGYHAWSVLQDTRLQWSIFTKVIHFEDGVLIFQGPTIFHWIPFSAIAEGSQMEDLALLLRSRITDHEERRWRHSSQ